MWRPSGHPKLWFLGGALALCRVYSRFLALQITASEKSLQSGAVLGAYHIMNIGVVTERGAETKCIDCTS